MANGDAALRNKWLDKLNWTAVAASIDALEADVTDLVRPESVVFCHNDLLAGNVIIKEHNAGVDFIDFEYGSANFRAFDIGNHFNEMCGASGGAALLAKSPMPSVGRGEPTLVPPPLWPPYPSRSRSLRPLSPNVCASLRRLATGLDTFDFSQYPDEELQKAWLRNYLAETKHVAPSEVEDKDVGRLFHETQVLGLASHLFWGIWALLQATFSTIDFDYFEYSLERIGVHNRMRDEVTRSARRYIARPPASA